MHVISRKKLVEFGADHAESIGPLDRWYRVAKKATWANFGDLRLDFPGADQVKHYTIFDIGGNKYRLVADIYFNDQVLLIRGLFTHRDDDNLEF